MYNTRCFSRLVLMLITLCWFGPAYASGNNIPLPELPEAVVKAAENAVPGISFIKAERLHSGGVVVYELEGYADAQEYEIKVDEAGEVLTVEKDND